MVRPPIPRRGFVQGLAAVVPALALLMTGREARAVTYSATERRCATCDFWRGRRRLSPDGKRVITPDDERAVCANGQSPLFNKVTVPGQVFPEGYKTWSQIQNFGN